MVLTKGAISIPRRDLTSGQAHGGEYRTVAIVSTSLAESNRVDGWTAFGRVLREG